MPVATLLIVDDHAAFRDAARRILEAGGFEVVGVAADGASGLRAARELVPDAVLLDVNMPGMDGFAVAAQLRAEGHPAAVIITSDGEREELEPLAASAGAVGFIPKAGLSGPAIARLLAAA